MQINKTGLARVLNEDNSLIGEYTNFQIQNNIATIEITLDGLKKTKDINVHELTWLYKDFLYHQGIMTHIWRTPNGWVADIYAKLKQPTRNDWFEPTFESDGTNDYSMNSYTIPKIKMIVNGRQVERSANHKEYHGTEFETVSMVMNWFLKNEDNVINLQEHLDKTKTQKETLTEDDMIGSN